ncbi:DUF4340 domain-containing protein [Anabaena sp. CCY 9910]|uniref:DUF4340 domain-containing protein n=1 Tax=Anabaena sp. CCY 9910 TaxID=3103870 RepID=UPI0039E1BB61
MTKKTLILLLLALGLSGFVYFWEIRGATQREEARENQRQIFSFTEDDVQSLTVKTQKLTVNLQRNQQSNQPKWLLKSPVSEPANEPIVSYLMDLLVKGKSTNTISTPPNQTAEFGLDQPQATININLKNQKTHQLILGKPDLNGRFVYAQADPITQANGNVNVLVVSIDFENAVNRELSEWRQPVSLDKVAPPNLPQPTPTNSP